MDRGTGLERVLVLTPRPAPRAPAARALAGTAPAACRPPARSAGAAPRTGHCPGHSRPPGGNNGQRWLTVSKSRLESFSDGVIAVAIMLLVLNLAVPRPGMPHTLAHSLLRQWPLYAAYVTSFLTAASAVAAGISEAELTISWGQMRSASIGAFGLQGRVVCGVPAALPRRRRR